MEQSESIKACGISLGEHHSYKNHINYIENKVAKNKGILFKAKLFLNK